MLKTGVYLIALFDNITAEDVESCNLCPVKMICEEDSFKDGSVILNANYIFIDKQIELKLV